MTDSDGKNQKHFPSIIQHFSFVIAFGCEWRGQDNDCTWAEW